ncbi:TRAP transporter permease [Chloroflexota bacterium]
MSDSSNVIAPESRYRQLKGVYRLIFLAFTVAGLGMAVIQIFNIVIIGRITMQSGYLAFLLAAFLPLVFLSIPASKRASRDRIPWYDLLAALLSMAGPSYYFLNAEEFSMSGVSVVPPASIVILGVITWFLVLEATRRTFGLSLVLVVFFFSVYPLFAYFLPGIFTAGKYSFSRVIGYHYIGPESIFGLPMRVFGRLLIGFILMGVALQATGGGTFFINFATALLGRIRGGAAKVSIMTSALFGSMSGSVVANVITTGSFTIPAMKKSGYPPFYAGAVEAAASTGGVLMPPIMGITAFIMADFLRITYAEVVIAAFIPSLLFYSAIFFQTDFYAAKEGIKGLTKEEIPSLKETLKIGWFYIFALFLLIYLLLVVRLEARAPFYAAGAIFLLAMIRKETRPNTRILLQFLEVSGKTLAELAAIMAAVGMIIGSLSLTGLAYSFASGLTDLAGGVLLLILLFAAFASFVMGMGVTISACYIFLALVVAPALNNLGIYPIAGHLFLLYWGMVSYITPPVAVGAYTAATLAGASGWKTGWQALRLGVVALIVPFFFVYNPALVAYGSLLEIVRTTGTALVGIGLLSAAFEGYLWWFGRLNPFVRILLAVAGLLFIAPIWQMSLISAALTIGGLGLTLASRQRSRITVQDRQG